MAPGPHAQTLPALFSSLYLNLSGACSPGSPGSCQATLLGIYGLCTSNPAPQSTCLVPTYVRLVK